MEATSISASSYSTIRIERTAGVAILTLDRPNARNALNRLMVDEIAKAVSELDADHRVKTVVLSATPPSFCSGLDLKESLPRDIATLQQDGFGDREAIARLRKPVIAAVVGAAMGAGCELALMSDIILGGRTARFSQPEVARGGMPGAGGTQRLSRLVGSMRAKEICLTGRIVEAPEALSIGLLLEVVDDTALLPRAIELAAKIAEAPSNVTVSIKQAFAAVDEMGLTQGLAFERQLSYACIASRNTKRDPD